MENQFNMNKEKFDKISNQILDVKNLPNHELVNIMDDLSFEFDKVKQNIIDMTFYLDKIELLYNNTLKEYQNRQNA
jgi:hypothetical protein